MSLIKIQLSVMIGKRNRHGPPLQFAARTYIIFSFFFFPLSIIQPLPLLKKIPLCWLFKLQLVAVHESVVHRAVVVIRASC